MWIPESKGLGTTQGAVLWPDEKRYSGQLTVTATLETPRVPSSLYFNSFCTKALIIKPMLFPLEAFPHLVFIEYLLDVTMFQVLTGFWKQLWANRFLFKGTSTYHRLFLPPSPAFCSVFSPISSSALPICSSSLRRWPRPMSVSSSFHAVPCDIISPGGLSLPTRSTFHPSHPLASPK